MRDARILLLDTFFKIKLSCSLDIGCSKFRRKRQKHETGGATGGNKVSLARYKNKKNISNIFCKLVIKAFIKVNM
jgi:hypothetical protein